jgi:Protein of unknown function (DUF3099)
MPQANRVRHGVPSITDAAPPKDDQLRRRRRVYTVLMIVHIAGLAVGGALYMQAWVLGLVILILTAPLPWIAVVLANDSPRPRRPRTPMPSAYHEPPQLGRTTRR